MDLLLLRPPPVLLPATSSLITLTIEHWPLPFALPLLWRGGGGASAPSPRPKFPFVAPAPSKYLPVVAPVASRRRCCHRAPDFSAVRAVRCARASATAFTPASQHHPPAPALLRLSPSPTARCDNDELGSGICAGGPVLFARGGSPGAKCSSPANSRMYCRLGRRTARLRFHCDWKSSHSNAIG